MTSFLRTLTVASLWPVPTVLPTNGTFVFCAPHPAAAIAAPPAHTPPIAIAFSGCVPAPINLGSWSIQQPTKLSAVLLPVKQSYPFLPRYSTAENKSQSIVWPPCASCRGAKCERTRGDFVTFVILIGAWRASVITSHI